VKTLLVIIGPTGVGKTELSLQLAEFFRTSILNADSRQLYRDIPIGTAAPTIEEMQRVPHYFVGTLGLQDYYSAAQYETDAITLLDQLFRDRDVVLLSGGSMMYIDAVCHGIDDIPTIDELTRERMRERYEREGLEPLQNELRLLDPEYYQICDIRNPKRVVHALEICYMTGRTYTSFRRNAHKERPFRIIKIGLQREREELYQRIGLRVDQMVEQGLIEEARRVLPFRDCNSLNTVGYKELFRYFDGEWDLDFALEKVKRNTRVYSRKQVTWFKKDGKVAWFHPSAVEEIRLFIKKELSS
jgi:tRNA dimethylallyltransferase